MIRAGIILIALAGVASAQPKPTKRTPAEQLLADVEANYQKPRHLSARFDQTVFNPTMGTTQPSNGTFLVEKPNKFRFIYLQPKRKDPKINTEIVFDGKELWAIDRKNLQYGKRASEGSELPSLITFFLGAGSLARDFNVATTTDEKLVPKGATALELTPKQKSASYAKLVLVLDAKKLVSQVSIVNSSGVVQTMTFSAIVLDQAAPAGTFALDRASIAGYQQVKP